MMTRRLAILSGLGVSAPGLLGFTLKPKPATPSMDCAADPDFCSEAQRRALLPHSNDPFWTLLKVCEISHNAQTNSYTLVPTPEVKALSGKTIQVKGFTIPLDGSDRTSHFLIAVNTPVCFYHPPGEPNEILEVTAAAPVTWDEKIKVVEGVFAIAAAGDAGVYFKLTQARLIGT